jgi:hypothetical protein
LKTCCEDRELKAESFQKQIQSEPMKTDTVIEKIRKVSFFMHQPVISQCSLSIISDRVNQIVLY